MFVQVGGDKRVVEVCEVSFEVRREDTARPVVAVSLARGSTSGQGKCAKIKREVGPPPGLHMQLRLTQMVAVLYCT